MTTNNYFIKVHSNFHIAHVYEHIFVRNIIESLYSKGYFRYLDIDIQGYTHRNYILLKVSSYNNKELEINKIISGLKIDPTDKQIKEALIEISTEYKKRMEGNFWDIKGELKLLSNENWLNFTDLDTKRLKPTNTKQENKIIWLTKKKYPVRKLTSRILLNKNCNHNKESLLLFRIISTAMQMNLVTLFCEDYHYYQRDYKDNFSHNPAHSEYMYDGAVEYRPMLTDETEQASKYIIKLIENGLIESIINFLLQTKKDGPTNIQLIEGVVKDTNLLVGALAWQKLASREKIQNIIDQLTFEIIYGKQINTFVIPQKSK